jgi:hypothetical protein
LLIFGRQSNSPSSKAKIIPFWPEIAIFTGQRVLFIWRIDVHKVLQIRKLGLLTALMPCLPSISLWARQKYLTAWKNILTLPWNYWKWIKINDRSKKIFQHSNEFSDCNVGKLK